MSSYECNGTVHLSMNILKSKIIMKHADEAESRNYNSKHEIFSIYFRR